MFWTHLFLKYKTVSENFYSISDEVLPVLKCHVSITWTQASLTNLIKLNAIYILAIYIFPDNQQNSIVSSYFKVFSKCFPANLSPATLREGILTLRSNNAIHLFSIRFASFYSIMLSYYTLIKWQNLKMYTASNLWQDCWQFTFMETLFLHKIVILDYFYRTEWLCNKKVALIVHTYVAWAF